MLPVAGPGKENIGNVLEGKLFQFLIPKRSLHMQSFTRMNYRLAGLDVLDNTKCYLFAAQCSSYLATQPAATYAAL